MEMQYFKDYSPALGREMECKVYGHAGRPILYIPCLLYTSDAADEL